MAESLEVFECRTDHFETIKYDNKKVAVGDKKIRQEQVGNVDNRKERPRRFYKTRQNLARHNYCDLRHIKFFFEFYNT